MAITPRGVVNQDIIDEITRIDYGRAAERITEAIRSRAVPGGLVLGLSGGVDSAVVAALCSKVLRESTLALIMPDSEVTPDGETRDALQLVDSLRLEYKLIDIAPVVKSYTARLEPDARATGNLRARIRASILYYYANAGGRLVLGCSDRSEWLAGYFTKFGDGASDMAPIVSLYKLQVRRMAEHLGIPRGIISKPSSPHLWKDHTAEDELGMAYEELDPILYCMYDKNLSIGETAARCRADEEVVERIAQLHEDSGHKRRTA